MIWQGIPVYDCPWEKCVPVVVLKSCDLSVCYIGSTCTYIVQSIFFFTFPAPFRVRITFGNISIRMVNFRHVLLR